MVLDADVLIDLIRNHPPALKWFASLDQAVSISGFAALELIHGCKTKAALNKCKTFLKPFPVLWPSTNDMALALQELSSLRLSHGVGLIDSIIAATVIGANEELVTFNVRHFGAVPRLITKQPYER